MPFKKGQSGNPGGRSKKQREIEALAQGVLERNDENMAVLLLTEIAINDPDSAARINALKLLMGYAYGNPRQRTEITGKDGSSLLDPREWTDATILGHAAKLRAKKK